MDAQEEGGGGNYSTEEKHYCFEIGSKSIFSGCVGNLGISFISNFKMTLMNGVSLGMMDLSQLFST